MNAVLAYLDPTEYLNNFKLIKKNEKLLMFVFILLLNNQDFEYILNQIYQKNKQKDQTFDEFKEILKNNLNFLYNDIFPNPEKDNIKVKLDSFTLSANNDDYKENQYFYDFDYITNIKNEFDFKIKGNLINYEINKFYFYINEIKNNEIILKNSEEQLIINKDNKTKDDKTDKETSIIDNEYKIISYNITNYDELYSSKYNYKLNEVFENNYNLPFFSDVNKDHFLIKFYNIESIPESLKPEIITQDSDIDLNKFDISNFNEIFFNDEQNENRFDYLNDIIVYLYGKKYYLYIIFIIVKFLDFYENDFLNYINYLCEPNKYISLIILLKIYEKVKSIEGRELYGRERDYTIDILEFYELDKKKDILLKEKEILKKKEINIKKLIDEYIKRSEEEEELDLENNELYRKYIATQRNINSKYIIAENKYNELDNFTFENININTDYIKLLKDFLKIENKLIFSNFFINLINKLQNYTNYDNFFILYNDVFCNNEYEYIQSLILNTVIENNYNIQFNENLINILFFSKERFNLPVIIFNKNYSKLNIKKDDKISFLEAGIDLKQDIETYILKNLFLEKDNLKITQNTPTLMKLIKSYYDLKPNKKELVESIKELKEKVDKEIKNIKKYMTDFEKEINKKEFTSFINRLNNIKDTEENFNDDYFLDENDKFLINIQKENKSFKKIDVIQNDLYKSIDDYKTGVKSYEDFKSNINKIIELNEKNSNIISEIMQNEDIKILNAYFFKYDLEGFKFITLVKKGDVNNIIKDLIEYKNNIFKFNINHILNYLNEFKINIFENINSEEDILINYKNNLIKIIKDRDIFHIIYLEIDNLFTFYIHKIEKNKYEYIIYQIDQNSKILKKYLLNDLKDIDFNYNIINEDGYKTKLSGIDITYKDNGKGEGDINFSNIKFKGEFTKESESLILSGYFYNNDDTLIKGKYDLNDLEFFDVYPLINNNVDIIKNNIDDEDNEGVKINRQFENREINNILSNFKNSDKYTEDIFKQELTKKYRINIDITNIKDYLDLTYIEKPQKSDNENQAIKEREELQKEKEKLRKLFEIRNLTNNDFLNNILNVNFINQELLNNIIRLNLKFIDKKIYIFDCMNLLKKDNFSKTNENLENFFNKVNKINYLNNNYNFYLNSEKTKIDENSFRIYVYQKAIGLNEEYLKIEKNSNYMTIGVACIYDQKDCYKNYDISYKNPNDDYVILQLYRYFYFLEIDRDVKIISNDKFREWNIQPNVNDILNHKENINQSTSKVELIPKTNEKTYSSIVKKLNFLDDRNFPILSVKEQVRSGQLTDQTNQSTNVQTPFSQEQVRSAPLGNDQTSFSQDEPISANQDRRQEPTFNDWLEAFDRLLGLIETQQLKPGNNEKNLDFVKRWTFFINELNKFLTRDILDVDKENLRGMLSRLDNQSTLNYLKEFESFPPFHLEFANLLINHRIILPERGKQLGGRRKLRIMYNNI